MKLNTPLRRGVKRLAYAAALTLATIATAHAAYPERPVTLVVPYPPAGTTDIAARTMAQAMEAGLGQTIVVENRAGAGGSIGMGVVARAKPDGYTIGMGTIGTQTINQFLYTDMPFDPEKDFVPIALVVTTPNIIAVNAKSDIKNLADLIAKAKSSKDEKLTYATPGIGSSVHLTGAYLEQVAGIEMLHIPFKGEGPALTELLGGRVDQFFGNISAVLKYHETKQVKLLGLAAPKRGSMAPNVPTVAEGGLADFNSSAWFALAAPPGTPAAIAGKLNAAMVDILKMPDVVQKFAVYGAEPIGGSGADMNTFVQAERNRWKQVIETAKVTVD